MKIEKMEVLGWIVPNLDEAIKLFSEIFETEFINYGEIKDEDAKYWANASIEDKMEMITYLRECFYGSEATTGRLQGFFEFIEQERC